VLLLSQREYLGFRRRLLKIGAERLILDDFFAFPPSTSGSADGFAFVHRFLAFPLRVKPKRSSGMEHVGNEDLVLIAGGVVGIASLQVVVSRSERCRSKNSWFWHMQVPRFAVFFPKSRFESTFRRKVRSNRSLWRSYH
jgi:hypothetical protein